ncbi:MAG: ParB/RepB/Spo0J family partition protein [Planctomycetota bacterium]|jgi:ParB family chromosome partitioning protein
MARKKSTTKKKAGRKTPSRAKAVKASRRKKATRASASRKKLTPSKQKRGLDAGDVALDLADASVAALVAEIIAAGGAALAAYREPLSGKPLLLATVPIKAVKPTPFQRDLSPTHTKRLAARIDETGSFLDPLIVVRGDGGELWTPNGRHRLAAAKILGLKLVTVLVSPEEDLAFKILALNTEKAHNLKDRSLEVIRMARELAKRTPRAKESAYVAEFEAPELLTLGIIYETESRFAGGAYSPFLKKIDRFTDKTLPASLRQREGYAAKLLAIDVVVKQIIEELKERGFKTPYLRNYVVARINPVRWTRAKKGETEPPMPIGAALTRMARSAKSFDVGSVRQSDMAIVAALSPEE